MPAYEIAHSPRLSSEEKELWRGLLRERDFGEAAIDWCEALADSGPANLELHYFQVRAEGRPKALVILHLLRGVDLARYIGKAGRGLFGLLGRLGWHPLRLDLAFVEVPLANLCGIRPAPGAEGEMLEIARQVCARIRREHKHDILCLKASPGAGGEGELAGLGMMSTDFLANMTLALRGFADFPAYVASLRPRLRTQVRAYARSFAAAGGKIEVCESPSEADLDAFARLYASTCDRHARLGEIEVPIPLDRAFFERIFRMPEGRRRAFVARLGGEAIAFALTVDSGRSLYFTHCGLDYGRAAPTRAYFNLYYAMIEYAIARGYEEVELGAQAYEVKRKLGGVAHATRYHFEVARPVLGAVARLVAGNFSSQEGSAVSSKATS